MIDEEINKIILKHFLYLVTYILLDNLMSTKDRKIVTINSKIK